MPNQPNKLWIPKAKLSDRAIEMAWQLFLAKWRTTVESTSRLPADWSDETVYRRCLEAALTIEKIEAESV